MFVFERGVDYEMEGRIDGGVNERMDEWMNEWMIGESSEKN